MKRKVKSKAKAAAKGCGLCAAIGESVTWGNNRLSPHPPDAVNELKVLSEDLRQCPRCGTRYRYSARYEHAPDHFMPDCMETLTRLGP